MGAAEALDVGTRLRSTAWMALSGGLGQGPERVAPARRDGGHRGRRPWRDRGNRSGPSAGARSDRSTAADDKMTAEIDQLIDGLSRAEVASRGMAELLGTPGRYLAFAGNNAQMQNGHGMFLSYGLLETGGGGLARRDEHDHRASVAKGADRGRRGPVWQLARDHPSYDWRHLGMTPRFPVTARTAVDLWAAIGKPPVQGVLAVDVVGSKAFSRSPGRSTSTASPSAPTAWSSSVLHDQYLEFFGDGDQTYEEYEQAQGARRDRLSAVAEAAIDAFDAKRDVPLDELQPLASAARGRHILAWSADPEIGAAFAAAGIDGGSRSARCRLGSSTEAASSSDWYTHAKAELRSQEVADGHEITVRVKVKNVAPANEPPYVIGPYPHSGLERRQYLGIVAITAPRIAQDLRVTSGQQVLADGHDGDHRVIGVRILVSAGSEDTVEFTFRLPEGSDALRIESSARADGVEWIYRDKEWRDFAPRTVQLLPRGSSRDGGTTDRHGACPPRGFSHVESVSSTSIEPVRMTTLPCNAPRAQACIDIPAAPVQLAPRSLSVLTSRRIRSKPAQSRLSFCLEGERRSDATPSVFASDLDVLKLRRTRERKVQVAERLVTVPRDEVEPVALVRDAPAREPQRRTRRRSA